MLLVDGQGMNVFRLFQKHSLPIPGGGYTLGVILVIVTLVLRVVLLPGLQIPILVIFVPAILATATLAGFRAGVFATVVSCVCADVFLLPPHFSWIDPAASVAADLASLAITGLAVSGVCAILRKAIQQSEAAKADLAHALRAADQLAAEQKHTEKALRDSLERLERVLDNQTVGAVFWDLDTGVMIDANTAFLELLGYSRADVEQRCLYWQMLTPPEYLDMSRAEVDKFLATGRVGPYEKEYFCKDGSRKWLLFAGSSLGNNQCVEFCVDISARKRAEAALRQSEERYRMLHETMRDAFVQTTFDGKILALNDAFCELVGYSAKELHALKYQDLTPHRWHSVDAAQVSGQVLSRGYSDVYEKEYRRKDGSTIAVELRVMLSRDAQGEPETMWAIVRDLTERKQYEEHVRSMRDQLAHVGRLSELAQVSAGIAHELNQPLAAMMNYSNVAKRLIASRDETQLARAHDAIAKATDQAERAGLIIRRMRGFIEKRETKRAVEDVNTIVEEAVALGLLGTQGDGISTRLDLAEGLPEVRVDRVQIQQVIVNLMRNAIEAMAQAPQRDLTLSTAQSDDGDVVVSVRDTGQGLSKEFADRVFMPFFTTKPGGMGIGLVISQSIVEAHGGRMIVESEPGQGAVFQFRLPPADVTDRDQASDAAFGANAEDAASRRQTG